MKATLTLAMLAVAATLATAAAQSSAPKTTTTPMDTLRTIYLAGGSFFGTQYFFEHIDGVEHVRAGYINSAVPNPTYRSVCEGSARAAEGVRVDYDPRRVSLEYLINLFFLTIDPTSRCRQGDDVGPAYRTGIYYTDEADRGVIVPTVSRLAENYDRPVVVEVKPLDNFTPAEKWLQNYMHRSPGAHCTIPEPVMALAIVHSHDDETGDGASATRA